MGFRCAKCGRYVSDDETYWYDSYGKYCSESCSNQAYNERAYAEEQEEVRHENAIAEAQARQEAAMRESEAQKEAAEAAQRVADTQYEAARQARLAQQDKLEHEKQMAARENARRAHEAKLAKCILEDGVYYSPDKTAIVEVTKAVTRLVVPDYVKDISDGACMNHNDLKSVTLPEGLETIGDGSFEGCAALYDINFPKSLRKIGKEAFMDSGIEEINFPDGIKVRELPEDAFRGCTKLKNVDDVLCKIDVLGDGAFFNSGLTELTLPASIEKIAINAFGKCKNLKTLVVKEGVERIPSYSFKNCSALTSVTLPEGLKTIGDEAFCGCTALDADKLSLPNSVRTISDGAFKASFSGGTLTLEGNLEIGEKAFCCCGFSKLVIASGVRKIGREAFHRCDCLADIDLAVSDDVEMESLHIFSCCGREDGTLTIRGKIKALDRYVFDHVCAKNLVIAADVEKICTYAFIKGNMESLSITGNVKKIEGGAFCDCAHLKSLVITGSVAEIDYGAFSSSHLTNIELGNAVGKIGNAFDAYCDVPLVITTNRKEINQWFSMTESDTVTIKGNVEKIGKDAFHGFHLTSITLPSSVTEIGEDAFSWCEYLPSITLPAGVKKIGAGAFYWCKALTSITLPSGVTEIGAAAFYNCKSLRSITIPASVKKIGKNVFDACEKLFSINFSGTVKQWKAVEKNKFWIGDDEYSRAPAKVVQCSDGKVKIQEFNIAEKLWGTKKAKKRTIIILACLALVFLIKYAMGGEARFAKKAQKNFDSWYTTEADAIVGQTFTYNSVNSSSGEIIVKTQVPFAKDGFAYGNELYTVDTATRSVKCETRDGKKYRYAYFPDGSAYYGFNDDGSVGFVRPKEGAQFNAAQATEVIGKTFSGKWSDKFTADITFGADGTATVKFSDGDTGTGSYIASDEDNIVLYNHRDKGVWHKFVYSDDSDDVTFKRYYAEKLRNGRFDTSVSIDTHDDWKRK